MPKIKWNSPEHPELGASPVVWSCSIAMRADGSMETDFRGETGLQMFKAAMETLQMIDRLRAEPAYSFGREPAFDAGVGPS